MSLVSGQSVLASVRVAKALCVLAGLTFPISAAQGEWRPLGPWGGEALELAVFQDQAYACSQGGLFRSGDGGVTWTGLTPMLAGCTDLQGAESVLFAWAGATGLFRSLDGGQTWQDIHPEGTARVLSYAVQDTLLYAATETGLHLSRDHGATWRRKAAAPPGSLLGAQGGFLAALQPLGGIHISRDSGETWTEAFGFSPRQDMQIVRGILFHAREGLHRSPDLGLTWERVSESSGPMSKIAADTDYFWMVSDSSVFRSGDGGRTWERKGGAPSDAHLLARTGSGLLAGGHGWRGIFRRPDSAAAWQDANQGFHAQAAAAFAAGEGNLAVAGPAGISTTTDNGTAWRSSLPGAGELPDTCRYNAGAVSGGEILFTSHCGLHRSEDGGRNWEMVPRPRPQEDLFLTGLIAVGGRWLAGVAVASIGQTELFQGRDGGGIWRLSANGNTWEESRIGWPATNGYRNMPGALASRDSVVLASAYPDGLYRSADGGRSWQPANQGLPKDPRDPQRFAAITSLAMGDSLCYAGTELGTIYRSWNGGDTWEITGPDIIALRRPFLPPDFDQKPYPIPVTGLALSGSHVYATAAGSIFHTRDSGESWASVQDPWLRQGVLSVAADGSTVFALTACNGVWALGTGAELGTGIRKKAGQRRALYREPGRPGFFRNGQGKVRDLRGRSENQTSPGSVGIGKRF